MAPTVRIAHASCHTGAVSSQLFGGWGDVKNIRGGAAAAYDKDNASTFLCAVSGQTASGQEVIALLDKPPGRASTITARESMCFAKPKSMTHRAAAQLSVPARAAAAALHSVGLPPGQAFVCLLYTSPSPRDS